MAEQQEPIEEAKIEPEDPEYELQEGVRHKQQQESLNGTLKEALQNNVSDLRLIMNGSNYAFTKLNLQNKGLKEINDQICQYPHLRVLLLSTNLLSTTASFQKLKYPTSIDLSNNLLQDVSFLSRENCFEYMRILKLGSNKIQSLPTIRSHNLLYLVLNNNNISRLNEFTGHPKLRLLELRGNHINSLKGLAHAPALEEIYLADNQLQSFEGLEELPLLNKIHARKNKISEIVSFPLLPKLKYLNLRENAISKLNNLQGIIQCVENLNLLGNPLSEELGDDVKKEVWMKYRHYERINKSEVGAEEKQDFDKEYKERLAEQQRERLEKEAAEQQARELAEQEAREAAEREAEEAREAEEKKKQEAEGGQEEG